MPVSDRHLVDARQTLGAAFLMGLRLHVACPRGKRIGPVKVEPCGYDAELSLESIIWTRGAHFPSWRLRHFLKCPRCGTSPVRVAWLPGGSPAGRAGRDLYQCVRAATEASTAKQSEG